MARILVVDDDVAVFLETVVAHLLDEGHTVTSCETLRDAVEQLEQHSDEHDLAIIDIMIPIQEMDDEAFHRLTNRSPTGAVDAIEAGLPIIERANERGLHVAVLTNVTRATKPGVKILDRLDKLEEEGKIIGVWIKPPEGDFYDALSKPELERA